MCDSDLVPLRDAYTPWFLNGWVSFSQRPFMCNTVLTIGSFSAINAPTTGNTFDAFMANALAIGNAGEPTVRYIFSYT